MRLPVPDTQSRRLPLPDSQMQHRNSLMEMRRREKEIRDKRAAEQARKAQEETSRKLHRYSTASKVLFQHSNHDERAASASFQPVVPEPEPDEDDFDLEELEQAAMEQSIHEEPSSRYLAAPAEHDIMNEAIPEGVLSIDQGDEMSETVQEEATSFISASSVDDGDVSRISLGVHSSYSNVASSVAPSTEIPRPEPQPQPQPEVEEEVEKPPPRKKKDKSRSRVVVHVTRASGDHGSGYLNGSSTPVASNLGYGDPEIKAQQEQERAQQHPNDRGNQRHLHAMEREPSLQIVPPANLTVRQGVKDSTPLASNGRKAIDQSFAEEYHSGGKKALDVSRDETAETVNLSQDTLNTSGDSLNVSQDSSSDWPKSAVDQMTNAVKSFGSIFHAQDEQGQAQSNTMMPPSPPREMTASKPGSAQKPVASQQQSPPQDLAGALDSLNLDDRTQQSDDTSDMENRAMAQPPIPQQHQQPYLHPQLVMQQQQHHQRNQMPKMQQANTQIPPSNQNQSAIPQQQHLHPHLLQQHQQQFQGEPRGVRIPRPEQMNPVTPPAPPTKKPASSPSQVGQSTSPRTAARATSIVSSSAEPSPMMRMRNPNSEIASGQPMNQPNPELEKLTKQLANEVVQDESNSLLTEDITAQTGDVTEQTESVLSGKSEQSNTVTSGFTEEEFHAMKQRKWAEKKKIADRSRAREKERLNGGKKKKRDRKAKGATEASGIGATFETNFHKFLDVMLVACGKLEDEEDDTDSDFDESTVDASERTEEDDATNNENSLKSSSYMSPLTEAESRDFTETNNTVNSKATEPSSFGSKVFLEKMKDKNFIRDFISELSRFGIKMMLHKQQSTPKASLAQPDKVLMRLSLGAQDLSTGIYSEPHLKILDAKDGSVSVSFDLFHIRTIEKASVMRLKAYPLALPGNCFWIRSVDGDYVFESPDEEGAARFVHGMRWLIARLSFNLIIGNPTVGCELLEKIHSPPGDQEKERAMNDLSNHLAEKTFTGIRNG